MSAPEPSTTTSGTSIDPTGVIVQRFGMNQDGRDFVVGDIHGMFRHLSALLEQIEFDSEHDRVFSVGDLVDRGPHSGEALEWLDKPWFHACRGNHEQFALESEDPDQLDLWVGHNGGDWWLEVDSQDRETFRRAFGELPLAMEVQTRTGTVGVVHADVPPFMSWDHFMVLLESRNRDAVLYATWSRNRITGFNISTPVSGTVERVYCGHTPTRETVKIDNVYYIDTGAAYGKDGYDDAKLTIVQVHPERHREHSLRADALTAQS
ncbi:MAG: metallophosphoesterase [Gammaproteobacteria bacterium]